MSSLLYPALPGLKFEFLRYYMPSSDVQSALSGKASAISYRAFPLVHFEFDYEFLRDYNGEKQALEGLINQMDGRFDSFLFNDPDFHTATAQSFGTVASGTTTYQLVVTNQNVGGPGRAELVQNVNPGVTPTLYAGGTVIPSGHYSIGPTGIVTFSTLPTVGAALTWTGAFYYRCRFDEDHYDFKKIMVGLWSVDKITFTSFTL